MGGFAIGDGVMSASIKAGLAAMFSGPADGGAPYGKGAQPVAVVPSEGVSADRLPVQAR